MAAQTPLRIALERRPHTAAILDRVLPAPRHLEVEFVEVAPINAAFRRMIRSSEFDICEMAVGTHYLARAHGYDLMALPVFLARHYPHAAVQVNDEAGVRSPADLAGRRVGSRSFTMTTALWARGAFARSFALPLDDVQWVIADEEHVPGVKLPANVEYLPGADLRAMLRAGDLAAGIGLAVDDPHVRPLWTDPGPVQAEWLASTGADPVNHTVVVAERVLARHPGIAHDLYAWFLESERLSWPDGRDGATSYGLDANRRALDVLLELTREQLPDEPALPASAQSCFLPVT